MTFDDVIKEIYKPLIYQWPSPSGEMVSVAKQKTALQVVETIKELKQEYAPTIEMTFEEHEYFKRFRFTDSSFAQLAESVMKQGDEVKFGIKSTPLYLMGLSEEQLMQAWLHPETIKVIGENNDTATSGRNKD